MDISQTLSNGSTRTHYCMLVRLLGNRGVENNFFEWLGIQLSKFELHYRLQIRQYRNTDLLVAEIPMQFTFGDYPVAYSFDADYQSSNFVAIIALKHFDIPMYPILPKATLTSKEKF